MARAPIEDLIRQFVAFPSETEWIEFKVNNDDPDEIGKQISALSNAAALHRKERAFLIWGVQDTTHEIVGTSFRPREKRIGASELENWLATQLEPQVHFTISECDLDGHHLVVFEIEPASYAPVAFKRERWIRVGTYTKPLLRHSEKERALWAVFGRQSFEIGIAAYGLSAEAVVNLIHYRDYFVLAKKEVPPLAEAMSKLCRAKILTAESGDRYNITNLGALLLAKDIRRFETIRRKTLRVVFYKSNSRTETFMEQEGRRGYASGFRGMIGYLVAHLPHSEEIKKALRVEMPMYPEIALRELVANALVHQDFEITGAGPMVEIFRDRVEITNPGRPLNDIQRLLDLPARSRNEKVGEVMRRLRVCEERGTGIDKALTIVEAFQLPAPDFQIVGDNMRVTLFTPRPFTEMTKLDRIRACYQHAGLQSTMNQQMTNESLRQRFGLAESQAYQASRIIAEALAANLIKAYDPSNTSKRHARYVPFWA